MFLVDFVNQSQLFFLVFARVMALILTAPLTSSDVVPSVAKIGLGFFASAGVFPWVKNLGYTVTSGGLEYVLLLVGEIFIGILVGFFLQIVYMVFSSAGQFLTMQLGFGASEVMDPLSNEEVPLLGQFLNLLAVYVFLSSQGLQKVFLYGVYGSFQAVHVTDIAKGIPYLSTFFIQGLSQLFIQALVLALPVLGTLFLVSISMGLMTKAAPQLNLLQMGFPVNILISYVILILLLPQLMQIYAGMIDSSFTTLSELFKNLGGQVPGSSGGAPFGSAGNPVTGGL